ncbi:hypothetical protein Tco_1087817 [Tanacetum coccineum]
MEKIFQIFQDLRFDISFADALLLMLRFAPDDLRVCPDLGKVVEFAKIPRSSSTLSYLGDLFEVGIHGQCFNCMVYGEEITLRVDNEAVTFNLDQTTRYSSTNDKSVNRIDIIDAVCEEYAPELLGFPNSSGGNPTPTSEPFTSEFILEEIEAYLKDDSISPEIDHADCDPEEDICLIEKLLNNDPFQLPPMDLKQSKVTEAKSSIEEPPELELKDLPSHLEYAFLEENDKLPVIIAKGYFTNHTIDPQDPRGKTTFTCPYGTFAEGIMLGHKISKSGIEVDRAKVDVIAKLPHPTTVKGVRSFVGHAGFYQRFIQDFSKIARPMTHLLEKEIPFVFSKDCIDAFQTLKKKLTEAPILVVLD